MTRENSTDSHQVETDVLVIGGGGTGLAAAVSAAEEGAKVIVAEKCNSPGGTTGLSEVGLSLDEKGCWRCPFFWLFD